MNHPNTTSGNGQQSPVLWVAVYMLSLNFVWLFVWHERVRSHALFSWYKAAAYMQHLSWNLRMNEPATVIEQVAWSLALSVVIFLVVVLLIRISAIRRPVCLFGLILSITGFPLLAACFPTEFFYPARIRTCAPWLLVETAALLAWVVVFNYWRKPYAPLSLSVSLLALHFGLWSWTTGAWVNPAHEIRSYSFHSLEIWISSMFYWGFTLIGFLSALASGIYIRQRSAVLL